MDPLPIRHSIAGKSIIFDCPALIVTRPAQRMATASITLGSGNLRGSFGFGKREDYTYDVPDGAIHVSMDQEDRSQNNLNFGNGNGKVTLNWDKAAKKAHVHAWVNGALGSANEVRWTVYAWVLV